MFVRINQRDAILCTVDKKSRINLKICLHSSVLWGGPERGGGRGNGGVWVGERVSILVLFGDTVLNIIVLK